MAVTTTDPKASTMSGHAPKGGCCGGAVAAEAKTDPASDAIRDDHHQHAMSLEVDGSSSCCCGTTKDSWSIRTVAVLSPSENPGRPTGVEGSGT